MNASPQVSQQAVVNGHHNIIVQSTGDGAIIIRDLPHLTLIPPANRLPRSPLRSEVDLLNPYRRAIPLVGRVRDLASLWDWLHSPRPISVRTLCGRAGAGKTRAAIELIHRLDTDLPAEAVVRKGMRIAAEICIYTNENLVVETIGA